MILIIYLYNLKNRLIFIEEIFNKLFDNKTNVINLVEICYGLGLVLGLGLISAEPRLGSAHKWLPAS